MYLRATALIAPARHAVNLISTRFTGALLGNGFRIGKGPRIRDGCVSGLAHQRKRSRSALERRDEPEFFAVLAERWDDVAIEQLQTALAFGGRDGPVKPEGEDTRTQHIKDHLELGNDMIGRAGDHLQVFLNLRIAGVNLALNLLNLLIGLLPSGGEQRLARSVGAVERGKA